MTRNHETHLGEPRAISDPSEAPGITGEGPRVAHWPGRRQTLGSKMSLQEDIVPPGRWLSRTSRASGGDLWMSQGAPWVISTVSIATSPGWNLHSPAFCSPHYLLTLPFYLSTEVSTVSSKVCYWVSRPKESKPSYPLSEHWTEGDIKTVGNAHKVSMSKPIFFLYNYSQMLRGEMEGNKILEYIKNHRK